MDPLAESILRDHVQLVRFADSLPTLFNACKSELGRPDLPIDMGKADVFRRSSAFQQFVTDVLASLAPSGSTPQLAPLQPTAVFGLDTEPRRRSGGHREADEALADTYPLYRALRRRIYRHVCRGHAECIRAAQRTLWWDMEGERTASFCPTAMAYLRWRMQWEGCRIPGLIDSKAHKRSLSGILGWLSADAPIGSTLWTRALDRWIRSQLFVCAVIDSFAHWQEVTVEIGATVTWQKSVTARFGKRHWACSGRGTRFEPALFYVEPAYLQLASVPPASGAHVRRTRAILRTIQR